MAAKPIYRRPRDALVLKALTIVLAPVLPVSPRCTHVKGNGGAKAAVRQVSAALATNRFVLSTGVKSHYASKIRDRPSRRAVEVSFATNSAAAGRQHPQQIPLFQRQIDRGGRQAAFSSRCPG